MYRMRIYSTDSVQTIYTRGKKKNPVLLEVGQIYQVSYFKPTTKKERANNGRIVEVLGFTDSFAGDVIVKYLDSKRRGRLGVNCLLPSSEHDIK